MLFLIFWSNSLLVAVAQLDERHANTEQLLCWSGMIDIAEHTTSSSNEEESLERWRHEKTPRRSRHGC